MSDKILSIENLSIRYVTEENTVAAVTNISLEIEKGKTLGLVGETGAGKTTTALGILNLVPDPPGEIYSGKILFNGENLLELSQNEIRKIRGSKISMIFQDPMTSLNPVLTVGDQIQEVVLLHNEVTKQEALDKAKNLMEMVGISGERHIEYPHQFSGGMKQRIVIAMALACEPELLLADEPTTAPTKDFFNNPMHPYSKALLSAIPEAVYSETKRERITLKGEITSPIEPKPGCRFAPRCEYASDVCPSKNIELLELEPEHFVACPRAMELLNK